MSEAILSLREISTILREICERIIFQLGSSHSEKVYQQAMLAELNSRSFLTLSEVCVPVLYKTALGHSVIVGEAYLDLWIVPWCVVVEVKHLIKPCKESSLQLLKYLDVDSHRKYGFVVTFPKTRDSNVTIESIPDIYQVCDSNETVI